MWASLLIQSQAHGGAQERNGGYEDWHTGMAPASSCAKQTSKGGAQLAPLEEHKPLISQP